MTFEMGVASDVWACGVTLYLMQFSKYPFQSDSLPGLYKTICDTEPEYPGNVESQLLDLLKKIF